MPEHETAVAIRRLAHLAVRIAQQRAALVGLFQSGTVDTALFRAYTQALGELDAQLDSAVAALPAPLREELHRG